MTSFIRQGTPRDTGSDVSDLVHFPIVYFISRTRLDSFAEVLADKFVGVGNGRTRDEIFARYAAYQEVERAV